MLRWNYTIYIYKEPQNHTDNEYDYKNKALHLYGYQATNNWTDRTFVEFEMIMLRNRNVWLRITKGDKTASSERMWMSRWKRNVYRNSVKNIQEDITRAGLFYWTNEDVWGKAEGLKLEHPQAPTQFFPLWNSDELSYSVRHAFKPNKLGNRV